MKFIQNLISIPILKKYKPFRSFLRMLASGFTNIVVHLKGLKFPSSWGWAQKFQFIFELYEPGTTILCKRIIKSGMYVFDIGANVGYYSILFSKLVGPEGKVYAFEPAPHIFRLLKHNLRKFHNCVIENKAVSDTMGYVNFFFSKHTTGSHGFYVPKDFILNNCIVETVSLAHYIYFNHVPRCDLIKIDVEGAEPLVIEGISDLIKHSKRLIVILELNPSAIRLGKRDPYAFLDELRQKFDFVYYIEKNGALSQLESGDLVATIPEFKAVNLLCLKGYII